jgi:hypothetical protein
MRSLGIKEEVFNHFKQLKRELAVKLDKELTDSSFLEILLKNAEVDK